MLLIDSSFLIEAIKRKIVIPKAVYIVPSSVYKELKSMAKNKGKKGAHARTALNIIKNFYIYPTKLKPDEAIIDISKRYDIPVLTFDLSIRSKVRYVDIKDRYVELD